MVKLCTELQGGTWQTYLHSHLKEKELDRLNALPVMKLLSALQLKEAVGAVRVQNLLNKAKPIMPEIDLNGKRRCIYINDSGIRCIHYRQSGMCEEHMTHVRTSTPFFKSQTLQEQYNRYLRDPKKLHLDRELAMLRLMQQKLMDMIQGDTIPVNIIQHMTVLTRDIKSMVEACTKMNQLTPETVDNILNEVVKILSQYVPSEKLEEAATKLQKLTLTDPTSDIPLDPGVEIEVDGDVREVTVVDARAIQRRAMMETYGDLLDSDNKATLESM